MNLIITHYISIELQVLFLFLVAQLCLTLREPMGCTPAGSSVHRISQARIMQWVVIPFSRRSSRPRDRT